jgi:hypothetical protein
MHSYYLLQSHYHIQINAIIAAPESTMYMYGIPIPKVWPLVQPVVPTTVALNSLPILPEITTMGMTPQDIPSALYGKLFIINPLKQEFDEY